MKIEPTRPKRLSTTNGEHTMRTINEIRQAITEQAQGGDTICIRFCEIQLDVWMDARDVAEAGGPYSWVEDNCDLEEDELDLITNHDYEVVDDEGGVVGHFCHYNSGWGSCDWLGLEEALEEMERECLEEEMVLAGLALGIPMSRIREAYQGEYSNHEAFAEQLWEDCGYLSEMPEFAQGYIDWESVARDLMINDFNEENGHYFSNCW